MTKAPSLKLKKPYHHGDLRENLVAAGEALLARLTPSEVSLREIARRAGVSHAAPKHHFATLGELLGEIAARGFERFVAELGSAAERAIDQSPQGRLAAMGSAYVRFAEANPAVYGLMFGKKDECARTEHLMKAAAAAWQQLEGAVAPIAGGNTQAAALLVWSSVHGLSMLILERRLPPHVSVAEPAASIMLMVLAGIAAKQ